MTRHSFKGSPSLIMAVVLLAIVVLFGPTTQAQERLIITINDAVAGPGEQAYLEVSLANPVDEIFGFQLHLILNRNDVANFVVVEEDGRYFSEVDTVGTLLSGSFGTPWAEAVSTGELGLDLLVTGSTEWPSSPEYLQPQSGAVLFRVPIQMQSPLPPRPAERTAEAHVDIGFKRWFSFSTPTAESIGWITEIVPDTNYYMCTVPEPPPGTGCYEWTKTYEWECPEGGCDSMEIIMVDVAVLDETQVTLLDGSVRLHIWTCGDVNGSGDVTISDITRIIDHLFIDNPEIDPIEGGNANCTGELPTVLTIGDISALIDHLFLSTDPLCCQE